MVAKDDIHVLIRSLTASEKRYFKLSNALHNKEKQNSFVQLFDAIDKQESYNENAIIQKFKNEGFAKQFAVQKNKLYNLILKSLKQFKTKHATAELKVQDTLTYARILIEKDLVDQAVRQIQKAIALAKRFELVTLELKALEQLREASYIRGSVKELTHLIEDVLVRERDLLDTYNERIGLYEAKDEIFLLQRRNFLLKDSKYTPEEFRKLIPDKLEAKSLMNQVLFHELASIKGRMLDDTETFISELQYAKETLLSSEVYVDTPFRFLSIQYNMIQAQLLNHPPTSYELTHELESYMHELPKAKITSVFRFRCYTAIYNSRLGYYYMTAQWRKSVKLIEEQSEAFFNKYRDEYSMVHQIECVRAYFLTDNHSKSLRWCNRLINNTSATARIDLQGVSYLLTILLQFELRGAGHLQMFIGNAERFLESHGRVLAFEKAYLSFFKHIEIEYANSTVPRKVFREYLDKLNEVLEKGEDKLSTDKYIPFSFWFESRVTGRKLSPIYKAALEADRKWE